MKMMAHLSLLIVCSVLFKFSESFNIEISPPNSIVHEQKGGQLTLECSVGDNGEEDVKSITWLKNGAPLPSGSYERLEDENVVELHLKSLKESDSGNYSCKVKDQFKSILLVVYEPPRLDKGLSEQHVMLHHEGLIKCVIKSTLGHTLRWERKGVRLLMRGGNYSLQNDSLWIKNVSTHDGGRYICKAKVSELGKIFDFPINVEVRDPPHVYSWKRIARANEGSSTSIICAASGLPKPTFKFYKDNSKKAMVSSTGKTINAEEGKLYFQAVTLADAGNYTCEAENILANDSRTNRLIVMAPPKITEFNNKTFKSGDTLKIKCKSIGFPTPKLTIFKSDSSGNKTLKESAIGDGESWTVLEYEKEGKVDLVEDAGTYTCLANNSVGFVLDDAVVEFLYAPFFNKTPKQDEYLLTNHTNNITCKVFSNPLANIVWNKNDQPIPVKSNRVFEIYEGVLGQMLESTLQITPTADESGSYMCRASNEYGFVSSTIKVENAVVPDGPSSVVIKEKHPTSMLLAVKDGWNGGNEVSKYRVEHNVSGTADLKQVILEKVPQKNEDYDAILKIENLNPKTSYEFHVSAVNLVGSGQALSVVGETEAMSFPQKVIIEKDKLPCYQPDNVVIRWKEPDSSGAKLEKYQVKYREIIDSTPKQYITKETTLLNYKLEGLTDYPKYEVIVRAKNVVGWSPDSDPMPFHVCRESNSPVHSPASQNPQQGSSQGNNTGWLLGIVFGVLVVVCILVDLACYAANGCGVTKLICTKIRGGGGDDKKYGEKVEQEEREFLNMEDKQTNKIQPTEV